MIFGDESSYQLHKINSKANWNANKAIEPENNKKKQLENDRKSLLCVCKSE